MDQPPTKRRRFRFGLRSLLLLVAVCATAVGAYCYWLRLVPDEVRQVAIGMSQTEVLQTLGPRHSRFGQGDMWVYQGQGDTWVYQYEWGQLQLLFHSHGGNCCGVAYWVKEKHEWHFNGPERLP